jgi:hypothetical protein
MYRLMGRAHAGLYRTYRSLAAERGQGTVEYVALVLLIAGVFAVVVGAAGGVNGGQVRDLIVNKIKGAVDTFGQSGVPSGKN